MSISEETIDKSASNLGDPDSHDETAPSSQYDDEDEYIEQEDAVPLLKYNRMEGSLPRLTKRVRGETIPYNPLASACTCCKMGRVILPPEPLTPDTVAETAANSNKNSDLWQIPHIVMAVGFQSGQIYFLDAQSGHAIIPSDQLKLKEGSHTDPVVDVSLDASGSFLAAVNSTGICAIWEMRYTSGKYKNALLPTQPTETHTTKDNPFASFLSTLAGPAIASATSDNQPMTHVSHLKTSSVQVFRISYPPSFGSPSVLCLDPSYKRRREKAVMVGFVDGRLMLTKRGLLFQRRNDTVIYQGSKGTGGIEAIEWRGSLVAWADASGIKLFDIESMSRIAHVDRPSGARSALYPTISSLKPKLCFETSDNLLVAWGDCIMTMTIKETITGKPQDATLVETHGLTADAPNPTDTGASIVKRRTVECTMAWELDCIACGVAPFDADHLVILGLVPTMDGEEHIPTQANMEANDVEVQIISRAEGAVVYADILPIVRRPSQFIATSSGVMQESAGMYSLLSSFYIPRMDDAVESEEEGTLAAEQDFEFNIFASATKSTFLDFHLKWNMQNVAFEKEETLELNVDEKMNELSDEIGNIESSQAADNDDATSVDSDDYDFILRPPKTDRAASTAETISSSPFMLVGSSADIIAIRVKDIDDAISHSLATQKLGLALRRGLRHKRKLRKHHLNDLVDQYLRAVLRISHKNSTSERKALSIRRLKLAAAATPILLGGNVNLWERWVDEFRKIPGALFVLRDFIPVRDPILPTHVHDNVLRTMLKETEELLLEESKGGELSADAINEATRRFLGTITSWGPTQGLRDKIKYYQFWNEQQSKIGAVVTGNSYLEDIKVALIRRLTQSAAGYLQLGSTSVPSSQGQTLELLDTTVEVHADSLFDVGDMVNEVSTRLAILGIGNDQVESLPSNRVAMETLAELHIMMGRYEEALQVFMAVGLLHSTKAFKELESEAVDCVNNWDAWIDRRNKSSIVNPYGFVLSMIEYHQLHQSLLNSYFLPSSGTFSAPLIALIRLVGLDSVGDFLVEHCVPPPAEVHLVPGSIESRSSTDTSDSSGLQDGKETLPLNFVAKQLVSNPKLRHWYLHLIFMRRPEMYVTFPTTAVPPRAVTELHRAHLDLYIEFANDKDSAKSLVGTESYNLGQKTTPLLSFLKAALPLGGIRPMEVRRLLETQRDENSGDLTKYPNSFAIELAYVIEQYGKDTEEDALTILDLYLKGANSVILATSYAHRNAMHTIVLWNTLIQYCLEGIRIDTSSGDDTRSDGALFGSLLESAALCGADLALLVTRIPQGMKIEGLRPRLVAAVGDYRLKLQMHEATSDIGNREKISLLREWTHRSRRAMRYSRVSGEGQLVGATPTISVAIKSAVLKRHGQNTLERPNRYRRSLTIPMR